MLDKIIMSAFNRLSKDGMTSELEHEIMMLLDTLIQIEDIQELPLDVFYPFMLSLSIENLNPRISRIYNELRSKVIRLSLGDNWQHGMLVDSICFSDANRDMIVAEHQINIYEDGFVSREQLFSIQPNTDPDLNILNDLGQFALKIKN